MHPWIFLIAVASAWAGVDTPYTPQLETALKSWPPRTRRNPPSSSPLQLECFSTPGNESYVGVGQWMTIAAPLEAVTRVLGDFEHYAELFPDLKRVSATGGGSRFETLWEVDIPIFFIPNAKYRMAYSVDSATSGRRSYHYQLTEVSDLKKSDGLIVLESVPPGGSTTYYTEIDFVEADWGLLGALAPHRIWSETVAGIGKSDLAVQLKAEHPDWANSKIKEAANKLLTDDQADRCVHEKHLFSLGDFMK